MKKNIAIIIVLFIIKKIIIKCPHSGRRCLLCSHPAFEDYCVAILHNVVSSFNSHEALVNNFGLISAINRNFVKIYNVSLYETFL